MPVKRWAGALSKPPKRRAFAAVLALSALGACGEDPAPPPKEAQPKPQPQRRPEAAAIAPEAVAAPKAPASAGAASGAATALRLYYDHIEAGRYEAAFELREPGEADAAAFVAHFRRFASQKVSIGLPSIPVEGKGWLYVEVPVQTYGTMTDGTPFGSAGTVTLRRRASGGDWRIYTK